MEVFISELEKLWKRRIVWILLAIIPLTIYGASKYYLGKNIRLAITSPEFISFGNYSFMVFQEFLILYFNIVLILLIVMIFTEEYTSKAMRMVFIRGYSFSKIYFSKIAAVFFTMGIFFITYFLISNAMGYIFAPKLQNVALFFHENLVSNKEAVLYSFKYYVLSFITIIAMGSVITLIAVLSKNVIGALSTSIGFVLFSLSVSTIISYLHPIIKSLSVYLSFSFLTMIQYQGICVLLAEKPMLTMWIMLITFIHIILFGGLSYIIFTKKDKFE